MLSLRTLEAEWTVTAACPHHSQLMPTALWN